MSDHEATRILQRSMILQLPQAQLDYLRELRRRYRSVPSVFVASQIRAATAMLGLGMGIKTVAGFERLALEAGLSLD